MQRGYRRSISAKLILFLSNIISFLTWQCCRAFSRLNFDFHISSNFMCEAAHGHLNLDLGDGKINNHTQYVCQIKRGWN